MVPGATLGQMVESTMAAGKTTKCMAKVSIPGLTIVNTLESTYVTRNMDTENLIGQTVGSIQDTTKTESRRALVFT
jgi:mannose/fructose/N-acetylgalactosamine-specific phosphotransferase system component IID